MANRPMVHTGDKVTGKGRSRTFETPEDLLTACEEYLEWNDANPLLAAQAFHYQTTITIAEVPKPRAPSIVALCKFLGIHRHTWQNYRKSDEFDLVCEEVEGLMDAYKFENAAAGLMNSAIIIRDLGLTDKSEVNSTGTVTHVNYSPADYKQAELELGNKLDDLD